MSSQRKGIFHKGMESMGSCVCCSSTSRPRDLLLHMLALPPNCTRFLCIQLFADPWAVAMQAPLFLRFSRQRYWSELTFPWTSERIFQPRDRIPVSCIGRQILYHWATRKFPYHQGGPQTFICQIRVKTGKNVGFFFKAQFMLNMTELIWNVSLPLKKKNTCHPRSTNINTLNV